MNYFSDKNKRTAILGTLLFHVLVVIVLIFTGLTPPMPPRPEIGVEVNLGNSDQGMGEKQPEKPSQTVASSKPQPKSEKAPDKVVTQDQDKTVAVPDKKKKVEEKPNKVEPKKEPEKKVDKNYIFKKKNNAAVSGSEGNDNVPGDKGKIDGNPNAKNYQGSHGNGVSYSLKGRVGRSLPKPKVNYVEEGTVTVKIWVNKSGKVFNAEVQEKGTNTSDTQLRKLAIDAAKASLFDAKPDAAETQVGTIEYVFQIGG